MSREYLAYQLYCTLNLGSDCANLCTEEQHISTFFKEPDLDIIDIEMFVGTDITVLLAMTSLIALQKSVDRVQGRVQNNRYINDAVFNLLQLLPLNIVFDLNGRFWIVIDRGKNNSVGLRHQQFATYEDNRYTPACWSPRSGRPCTVSNLPLQYRVAAGEFRTG
jgi:hypothetical protein